MADPRTTFDPIEAVLLDPQTGQKWSGWSARGQEQGAYTLSGRAVADNGTVAGSNQGALFLVRNGKFDSPRSSSFPLIYAALPSIDAAGEVVVYQSGSPSPPYFSSLYVYRIASGSESLLLQADGDCYSAAVTADGKRVFFLSTAQFGTSDPPGVPQLYSIDVDHTGFRELTSFLEPSGVQQYTMTDDGRVLWYGSGDNRLVKLDLRNQDAVVRTVFNPPMVDLSSTLVPGSAVLLNASDISGEVSVTLDGLSAPVLSVTPASIVFQVPWELLPGRTVTMQVTVNDSSVFATVTPVARAPVLCAASPDCGNNFYTTAIHGDWSGPATGLNPASRGEIVYLYGTGLGPVQPQPPTVAPAPVGIPAPTITPLVCDAKVLFSGLAPGLVGYYQIAIQIPDSISLSQSLFELTCGDSIMASIPISYH